MKKLLLATTIICALASGANAVTLTAADVGDTGTTQLNGLVNGNVVPGLTGTLDLTFLSISGGGTTWNFAYTVDNTSSGGITSELSAFGLNTTPNVTGATATGLYGSDVSINTQLSSGTVIDFCASAGSTCSGGGSNGLSPTDPAASGLFSLIFGSAQTSISLDAAFARYQGITGNGFSGASGIGTNNDPCVGCTPTQVPGPVVGALLPSMVTAFGLLGFSAWRRRRKA